MKSLSAVYVLVRFGGNEAEGGGAAAAHSAVGPTCSTAADLFAAAGVRVSTTASGQAGSANYTVGEGVAAAEGEEDLSTFIIVMAVNLLAILCGNNHTTPHYAARHTRHAPCHAPHDIPEMPATAAGRSVLTHCVVCAHAQAWCGISGSVCPGQRVGMRVTPTIGQR